MRGILYAGILLLAFFAPVKRLDIAKLQPIEAVAVSTEGDTVILRTDTGDVGKGSTAKEALDDLKESASAVIYLDTARYLLIGENAEREAESLMREMKASVKKGEYRGGDVKEEARYLDVHSEAAKPNTGE